jgi:prophage DNA circulation protein
MANLNISDASFLGLKFHVAIPAIDYVASFGVMSHDITNERRLQFSSKPKVDVEQVEDFGRKSRIFNAEVVFFGDNYKLELAEFERTLNSGKSGKLMLPDLDEVVWAKYQKHTRKSSAQEGNSTILSVTWVEDYTTQNLGKTTTTNESSAMRAAENSANVESKLNSIQKLAAEAQELLTNNPVISAIKTAESAVTTARVTINSVVNVAKNTRESIISLDKSLTNTVAGLINTVEGIRNLKDQLKLNLRINNLTQYTSNLGAVDFKSVGTSSTSTVNGTSTVVATSTTTAVNISDYKEAISKLKEIVTSIKTDQQSLEIATEGSTKDFTKKTVAVVNEIKDLIDLIKVESTSQILTTINTSLIEVCFENGKTIDELDDVYFLNRHLDDILDIPRNSIIYL